MSHIWRLFGGVSESRLRCHDCGQIRVNRTPGMGIVLPLPLSSHEVLLPDLVTETCAPEELAGETAVMCALVRCLLCAES